MKVCWTVGLAFAGALGLVGWLLSVGLRADDVSLTHYPRYTVSIIDGAPLMLDRATGQTWRRVEFAQGRFPDGQREVWLYVDRLDTEAAVLAWTAKAIQ